MVEDAMLMSAIRKYNSWLTKRASAPIGTLRYMESVICEIDHEPWPSGYREYLERKLRQFTQLWAESVVASVATYAFLELVARQMIHDLGEDSLAGVHAPLWSIAAATRGGGSGADLGG